MLSYHHNSKTADKLVEYELSLPSSYDVMNLKGFCIYHKEDFNKRRVKAKLTGPSLKSINDSQLKHTIANE